MSSKKWLLRELYELKDRIETVKFNIQEQQDILTNYVNAKAKIEIRIEKLNGEDLKRTKKSLLFDKCDESHICSQYPNCELCDKKPHK